MARVVVTLKIMPDSPGTDLERIKTKAISLITGFGGKVGKESIEPVAFGLNSLSLIFIMDESVGSTEPLEEKISSVKGVGSVETVDVRRTIG